MGIKPLPTLHRIVLAVLSAIVVGSVLAALVWRAAHIQGADNRLAVYGAITGAFLGAALAFGGASLRFLGAVLGSMCGLQFFRCFPCDGSPFAMPLLGAAIGGFTFWFIDWELRQAPCDHPVKSGSGQHAVMKILRSVGLLVALLVVSLTAWRYATHQQDRSRALPVVSKIGGKVATIPFEPFDTEYAISLRDIDLTRSKIDQLVALGLLTRRNSVGIVVRKKRISERDLAYLRQLLPEARIIVESD